jgi:hypothetical protein
MAWTTPGTATAGEVLTAAFWNENVRDNSLMGNPVYTNEAARDAAIPTPSEGMRVYLTTPTVPAATNTAILPSGIQTIYNGSVWVCVTEVASVSTSVGTTTSATYADISFVGAVVSVTLVTGTTAMVHLTGDIEPWGGVVNAVSVKTATVAASDIFYTETAVSGQAGRLTTTAIFTGLTAGTNTFTLQGKVGSGGTVKVTNPSLIVKGIA